MHRMKAMNDVKTIALPLIYGGYYVGTPEECLTFLSKHSVIVEVGGTVSHFHYSETKDQYVYIGDMHPTYIRNVLHKELRMYTSHPGYDYMKYLLTDQEQLPELVAEALRLWYEMNGVDWDEHRDALLAVLESSALDIEDQEYKLS